LGDGPLDVGITNTDLDIASSAAFNSSFVVFEVAESAATSVAGYTYFFYNGYVYAYEVGVAFHFAGIWTPGAYFHLNMNHDPCNDLFTVTTSDGGVNFSFPMVNMAPWVSRVILQSENKAEIWDVDNFAIVRDGPCPTTCGADGIEAGEHCEIEAEGGDAACPGRCVAPGETGPDGQAECTCVVAGGLDPCDAITTADLPNGTTDVISHGGWFSFVADTTATAFETCGSTGFDSYMVVFTNADGSDDCSDETGLDVWITENDDCDVNSACCGFNADALASCHPVSSPWESCTCVATVVGQRYWVWEASGGGSIGGNILMTKTKRQECGVAWDNGACCDGVTGTCTSDVAPGDCAGELDTFTLNKDCDGLTCDAVPGSCCDSAPGLGGACNDGVLNADCQGTYQAWSSAACDGSCAEIEGACCDPLDGFCSSTLQGDCTAQHPNGPVWTVGAACNEVSCDPALGACCNTRFGTCTDNVILADCGGENLSWTKGDVCSASTCPDPFIPTVSQWGLVIMTLLLLIGAKVYFGRREALA
jgi:hypothetical protein